MGGRAPAPLPAPARPITAETKTPDLELQDDNAKTASGKNKKGKRALRTDVTATQQTGQMPSQTAGLQIKKGT